MLFNSVEFFIFLPIVFCIFWILARYGNRTQNLFIILASYFFYAQWDYRFLLLIIISSLTDYIIGILIGNNQQNRQRKLLLLLSLAINLGILFTYIYYDFFIENFNNAFSFLGSELNLQSLGLVLPVGISFYTFQTISYTIDIYNKKVSPTRDPLAFFAFVSFFPQLVAGPIETAKSFLPQFLTQRTFNLEKAKDGLRQILWGLIKKVVIADGCAIYVNDIFGSYTEQPSFMLILGGVLFMIQIYGDFSGYSDMAIGSGRLLGFNLRQNFAFPYFSKSTTEFWRRWHMSLGAWINSYVFNPIAKSLSSKAFSAGIVIALILTFLLMGLWHGPHWKFVIFGLINGLILSVEFSTKKLRKAVKKHLPKQLYSYLGWLITISGWFYSMIIFRATDLAEAKNYIVSIFSNENEASSLANAGLITLTITIFIFFLAEFMQRNKLHALEHIERVIPKASRWALYYVLFILLFFLGKEQQEFIYFQF